MQVVAVASRTPSKRRAAAPSHALLLSLETSSLLDDEDSEDEGDSEDQTTFTPSSNSSRDTIISFDDDVAPVAPVFLDEQKSLLDSRLYSSSSRDYDRLTPMLCDQRNLIVTAGDDRRPRLKTVPRPSSFTKLENEPREQHRNRLRSLHSDRYVALLSEGNKNARLGRISKTASKTNGTQVHKCPQYNYLTFGTNSLSASKQADVGFSASSNHRHHQGRHAVQERDSTLMRLSASSPSGFQLDRGSGRVAVLNSPSPVTTGASENTLVDREPKKQLRQGRSLVSDCDDDSERWQLLDETSQRESLDWTPWCSQVSFLHFAS